MKDPMSGYFLLYLVSCSQVPHMVINESVPMAGAMPCTPLDPPQHHSTECQARETCVEFNRIEGEQQVTDLSKYLWLWEFVFHVFRRCAQDR